VKNKEPSGVKHTADGALASNASVQTPATNKGHKILCLPKSSEDEGEELLCTEHRRTHSTLTAPAEIEGCKALLPY